MDAPKLYLGTNLKMYKNNRETLEYLFLLTAFTKDIARSSLELFVIPSFTSLADASRFVDHDRIRIGAQNMHWAESGQYTGEISPLMLKELSIDIVELGHSERRHVFGETDNLINLKALSAAEHSFTVLLCVGETADDKETGRTDEVLASQIATDLKGIEAYPESRLMVAYEPVWSIGVNGKPASPEYVSARHETIRRVLMDTAGAKADAVPILYGGSVNGDNAESYLSLRNVDGLFIGRYAWDAERFSKLIRKLMYSAR